LNILTLDLARLTGWAHGDVGTRTPASGVIELRGKKEPPEVAGANLIRFLEERFREQRPDYVTVEEMMPIPAMLKNHNQMSHIYQQCGLHLLTGAVCGLWKIPRTECNVNTARKHLTDKSTWGSRDETKLAVVRRCQLLGLMPSFRTSDDQADALCIWSWAGATYAFQRPIDLFMFGEENGPQP
jgi:hypothetical protein